MGINFSVNSSNSIPFSFGEAPTVIESFSPYIGENGNWVQYDISRGWVDTGISAEGKNGRSPYIGANGNWFQYDEDKGWVDTNISVNPKEIQEELALKVTQPYVRNDGETNITDSDNGVMRNIKVYGASHQDADASAENPKPITSVEKIQIGIKGNNLLHTYRAAGSKTAANGLTLTVIDGNTYSLWSSEPTPRITAITMYPSNYDSANRDPSKAIMMLEKGKTYYFSGCQLMGFYEGATSATSSNAAMTAGKNIIATFTPTKNFYLNGITAAVSANQLYKDEIFHIYLSEFPVDNVDELANYPYYEATKEIIPPKPMNGASYGADYIDVEEGFYRYAIKTIDEADFAFNINTDEAHFSDKASVAIPADDLAWFRLLATKYPYTRLSVVDQNGNDVVMNFSYKLKLENYIKKVTGQITDARETINNIRSRQVEDSYLVAASYVNSEFAVALAEMNY